MKKKLKTTPKTFALENDERIFVPKEPVVNAKNRYCCCVYVCSQFMKYPVDRWGRKIIPAGTICPYVKTLRGYPRYCAGNFVFRILKGNGIFTTYDRGMQSLCKVYTCARERD